MVLSSPIKIKALILRATPGQGNLWVINCFSDKVGRITFSSIPKRGACFSPFCCIEATLLPHKGYVIARDIEILDTFAEAHSHPDISKSALFLRAIIEKCLPLHAPSHDVWTLLTSLLGLLPSFNDWKAPPLLLALMFFEHEGISPISISELSSLTDEGRQAALQLLESNEAAWRSASIPEDLFTAVLETIGVSEEFAKGGT